MFNIINVLTLCVRREFSGRRWLATVGYLLHWLCPLFLATRLAADALSLGGFMTFRNFEVFSTSALFWVAFCALWLSVIPLSSCVILPYNNAIAKMLAVDMPAITVAKLKNHSHPLSAAQRNAAAETARMYADLLGARLFSYQGSASDARDGIAYSRTHLWAHDYDVPEAPFDPETSDVIFFGDVDYYLTVDEIAYLAYHTDRPLIVSAFIPMDAAASEGEYAYHFLEDGRVVYDVAGGARYVSHIWDWSMDIVTFWYRNTMLNYDVVRRKVDDRNHQLVFLIPRSRVNWAVQAASGTGYRSLERLKPVSNGFAVIRNMTSEGEIVSVSVCGHRSAVTIPRSVFDHVLTLGDVYQGAKLSVGVVAMAVKVYDVSDHGCAILVSYVRSRPENVQKRPLVIAPIDCHARFQLGERHDPEAKPTMFSFMSSLVLGGGCYDETPDNEFGAVCGRVKDIANVELTIRAKTFRFMKRFVRLIAGDNGVLQPLSLAEVRERRARPTQRAADAQEENSSAAAAGIRSFVKREAADALGDPRMIQPMRSNETSLYARYVLPIGQFLRRFDWYSPGKTPRRNAEIVANVCAGAEGAVMTDFSRMDGRVGVAARLLWQMFMLAMYGREHHVDIQERLRAQFAQWATGRYVKYWVGFQRCSGSMETTDANSLLTAFIMWASIVDAGHDEHEALSRFVVCGDDAVAAGLGLPIDYWSKECGMKVEEATVPGGSLGVNFLNRFYGPGVFRGDPTSIVDVRRVLKKFGLTTGLNGCAPIDKAREKAFALLLTDSDTPILGDFARTIMADDSPARIRCRLEVAPQHGIEFDREEQWPNLAADWMWDYIHGWMPGFNWQHFNVWRHTAVTDEELLAPPVCFTFEHEIKRSGFINGDYRRGPAYQERGVTRSAGLLVIDEAKANVLQQRQVAEALTGLSKADLEAFDDRCDVDFEAIVRASAAFEDDMQALRAVRATRVGRRRRRPVPT